MNRIRLSAPQGIYEAERADGGAAMIFVNRVDAGQKLARKLDAYARRENVLILGIPRGGVPVAFQVAAELGVPLDVFVVRKLGVPWHEELAFGAIATGGIRVLDGQIVEEAGISDLEIELIAAKERQELNRRESAYRGGRPPLNLKGKTVILVDDGIATGASTLAGITALRELKPARIVLAAPIAPAATYSRLRREVDDLICLDTPESFHAIGEFYEDFSQVSDEEVTNLLQLNSELSTHEVAATRRSIGKGVHA
jgi:putative phosphoribosyl transferase